MAPGYHDGLVYVSTVPTDVNATYNAGGVGVLWALDAKTGKKVWHFDTVADRPLGRARASTPAAASGTPPSFDGKGVDVLRHRQPGAVPRHRRQALGVEPARRRTSTPTRWSSSTPKTGKLQWYYQQTPHDIYDWDFQDPPILIKAGGRELAIGAGKSGIVVALDADTGKPVWKRPVGTHNGHDDDGLLAMRGEYSKLKTPMTVFPGHARRRDRADGDATARPSSCRWSTTR